MGASSVEVEYSALVCDHNYSLCVYISVIVISRVYVLVLIISVRGGITTKPLFVIEDMAPEFRMQRGVEETPVSNIFYGVCTTIFENIFLLNAECISYRHSLPHNTPPSVLKGNIVGSVYLGSSQAQRQ